MKMPQSFDDLKQCIATLEAIIEEEQESTPYRVVEAARNTVYTYLNHVQKDIRLLEMKEDN